MLLPMCKALYSLLLSGTPSHTWPHTCTLCAVPHIWCCIPNTQCCTLYASTAPQTCLYHCRYVDTTGSLLSFGGTGLWDLGAQNMDLPSFIQGLLPQLPPQFSNLGKWGHPVVTGMWSGDSLKVWGQPFLLLWQAESGKGSPGARYTLFLTP